MTQPAKSVQKVGRRDSLLGDSVFNFISQAFALTFAIATGIMLARMLGAEARGEYGMLILLPQTAVALLAGGVGPSIAYHVSSKKWADREVIPLTLGLCFYATTIGLVVLGIALAFRSQFLSNLPLELLLWAVPIYPASLCIAALQGVFVGYRRFRFQMQCTMWATVCSFLILLIPVVVLDLGIRGAVYGHCAGLLVSLFIHSICVLQIVKDAELRIELSWRRIADSISFGGKASIGNALGFLNYRLDQFFVNSMVGAYGVGIYVLAVSIVEKLWILAGNLATAMFPRVASADNSEEEAANLTARVAGLLSLALLVAGATAAMLAWVIPYIYGEEFADSIAVIFWLLPGCILWGHAKVIGSFFAGRGRVGCTAQVAFIGLIVNITANLILIPRYGVNGAAAATSCSYSVMSAIFYVLFVTQYSIRWYAPLTPRWSDIVNLFNEGAGLARRFRGRLGPVRRIQEATPSVPLERGTHHPDNSTSP